MAAVAITVVVATTLVMVATTAATAGMVAMVGTAVTVGTAATAMVGRVPTTDRGDGAAFITRHCGGAAFLTIMPTTPTTAGTAQ